MEIVKKFTVLFLIISSRVLFAQHDTIAWGRNSNFDKLYSVKTAIELKGEILAIEQVVFIKGITSGINLMVKSANKVIAVHVGPKWFLDHQTIKFKVNDKVIIRGSVVMHQGKPIIIARKIIRGRKILKIRDEHGNPDWASIGCR